MSEMEEETWRTRFTHAETEAEAKRRTNRKLWLRSIIASGCIVAALALVVTYRRLPTQTVLAPVVSSVQRVTEHVLQKAKELRDAKLGSSGASGSELVNHTPPRRPSSAHRSGRDNARQDAGSSSLSNQPFEVWAQDSTRRFLLQPVTNAYRLNIEQGTIYKIPVHGGLNMINSE